ncbi:hypothetical protein M9434_002774 [Picochlorum sp. BPE23]|nr:hypothetical protein M9434_002774 [Picochlorum sp. BPE23]
MRKNGIPEALENADGQRITPSCVHYSQTIMVGQQAKNKLNSSNTVLCIKRVIGKKYEDVPAEVKEFFGSKLVPKEDEMATLSLNVDGRDQFYRPEEVSAVILNHMKNVAQNKLQLKVQKAVITVPAYFNDAQRDATMVAGKIAGLDVVRVINEPTAAAIAFGLQNLKGNNAEKIILVFDLGGGTFDASLLSIKGETIEVLGTIGEPYLGGEDFDHRMVKHFQKKIEDKYNIVMNEKQFFRLKSHCEQAKKLLSNHYEAEIEIENISPDGDDFIDKITRNKFEQLNEDLFQKCLDLVKQLLTNLNRRKESVDDVILVGGSSRIPRVKTLLQEYFNQEHLNTKLHPDEAVALGAAIYAESRAPNACTDLLLLDRTSLSIGIETQGDKFSKIIPNNTLIPVVKARDGFRTVEDYQERVRVVVIEGESKHASRNHRLGEFTWKVRPALCREQNFQMKLQIDENGMLTATAKDTVSGDQRAITINYSEGRLSPRSIESARRRMQKKAEKSQ